MVKTIDYYGIERDIITRKEALEKGLNRYFTGKPCKRGHIAERRLPGSTCVPCGLKRSNDYYRNNREHSLNLMKKNHEDKRDKRNAYNQAWHKSNRPKVNEYRRRKYKEDPIYKMSRILPTLLKRTLKSTGNRKTSKTTGMLGYTKEDLIESIESKFQPDMTWDNYGHSGWHIDHKKSISSYLKDGITEPAIINALDNLIPMWDEDNFLKSHRTLEEFINDFPEEAEKYKKYL